MSLSLRFSTLLTSAATLLAGAHPFQKLVARQEIYDPLDWILYQRRSGQSEFDEGKLFGMMRIGINREINAGIASQCKQFDIEVLPIRIGIHFDGFIQLSRNREHSRPVCAQAQPMI